MKRVKVFLINALIVTATSLLLGSISVTFNVYLSGKIGAAGMGLYQLIMSIYSFAVIFASSGIGLAATRLVAEELAHGPNGCVKKAMGRCITYSICFGLAATLLLLLLAKPIGLHLLRDARTIPSLYVLALTLPFISISCSFNGYFTAMRRPVKSSSAQVLEQFVRIAAVVYLLQLLMPKGLEYACLALFLGGCIAEMLSFLYSLVLYLVDKRRPKNNETQPRNITRRMLGIALPIAFSSYLRTGLTSIKQLLIPSSLQKSGSSKEVALAQYGTINGMVMPIIYFPSAFLTAFSNLIVPELAEYHEQKNYARIDYVSARVFQIALLFSIGVAGILTCFSGALGTVIYHSADAGEYIGLLAPLITLMYLDQCVDGMLKGLNAQVVSMRINILDSFVSIILIYFLLPFFGIYGYILVIFFSELLNTSLSIWHLFKITNFRVKIFSWIIKPVLAIVFSLCLVKVVAYFCIGTSGTSVASLVVYIALSALIYLALLRIMGCVSKDDCRLIRSILH